MKLKTALAVLLVVALTTVSITLVVSYKKLNRVNNKFNINILNKKISEYNSIEESIANNLIRIRLLKTDENLKYKVMEHEPLIVEIQHQASQVDDYLVWLIKTTLRTHREKYNQFKYLDNKDTIAKVNLLDFKNLESTQSRALNTKHIDKLVKTVENLKNLSLKFWMELYKYDNKNDFLTERTNQLLKSKNFQISEFEDLFLGQKLIIIQELRNDIKETVNLHASEYVINCVLP